MGYMNSIQARAELKYDIQMGNLELLRLQRQQREASRYATAIGDGVITPDEMAGLSSEFTAHGINYSMEAGAQANDYSYAKLEEYYSLNPEAEIEDEEAYRMQLFQQGMQEYANNVTMQQMNDFQTALQTEIDMLQTELEQKQSMLNTLEQNISQGIQQSTLKLYVA